MRLLYYNELIKGNELLFWIYVFIMVLIIISSIILVRKEIKNEFK